jgi:DNA end-binding protein Ku
MPRPYWKGYLRLSLVTCPVELYPATSQSEKTHFHQINTKTGNRLRQQMVDEETGKPVPKEQKGRGYELSKGRYVPIDDEELTAVEIESNRTIDIQGFVPKDEIDKRYLDKPYYIAPSDKAGAEAFVVIRDALKSEDRVALGKIVMAHREHIIMIEPLGKGLLGTTLRFDYEVRDEKDYFADIPSPRISKDMVELASTSSRRRRPNSIPPASRTNMRWHSGSWFSARPGATPSSGRSRPSGRATSSISWRRCAKA